MSMHCFVSPTEYIDSSIAIDTLTGLGNVFAMLQATKSGLHEVVASRGTLLAVVLMRITDFDSLSLQVGEEASNEILKRISGTLYEVYKRREKTGLQGTLFRIANDEFALLVRHNNCLDLRALVAELRQAVADLTWPQQPCQFSLYASAACFPSCAATLGHLLAYTNLFLGKSKSGSQEHFACPGSPEYQDAQFLSIELHNNATTLIESFSEKILDTARQLGEAKLMAFTDPITQLPNQRAARSTLQEAKKQQQSLSLMLIDGDNLADYNQEFGYAAGNDMIFWLGQHVRSLAPSNSFVARWMCGDEFLVFTPGLGRDQCLELANYLRHNIHLESHELLIPITVSVGTATYPENGTTIEQLLEAIEAATKLAKESGRNRVCLF